MPLLKVLGPKYGRDLGMIQGLLREGEFRIDGDRVEVGDWVLEPGEYELRTKAREGFSVLDDHGYVVALDTEITPELALEGAARDVIRRINMMRKDAGPRGHRPHPADLSPRRRPGRGLRGARRLDRQRDPRRGRRARRRARHRPRLTAPVLQCGDAIAGPRGDGVPRQACGRVCARAGARGHAVQPRADAHGSLPAVEKLVGRPRRRARRARGRSSTRWSTPAATCHGWSRRRRSCCEAEWRYLFVSTISVYDGTGEPRRREGPGGDDDDPTVEESPATRTAR